MTPGAGTPPPGTPGQSAPADEIKRMMDLYSSTTKANNPPDVESMLNPMFARQRQKLVNEMNANAAASGAINSGGYSESLGSALSDLGAQQSGKLAEIMSTEHLARLQQNTQLTQLATEAGMQKYLSDINSDLTRFQVNTNADLQKWLSNADNTLKKYGIDSNDVLQRYLGKLGLEGKQIDANAQVSAAQLHAAAAESAAMASSAASQANAKLSYDLGLAGLGVERENNIANYIIGLLTLGQKGVMGLGDILGGIPPGSIVVKP